MLQHLKSLCEIDGIAGREGAVREYIQERLPNNCEYHLDNLGNIIGHKPGKGKAAHTIMIDAHMDEVGVMLTYPMPDGRYQFAAAGSILPSVLAGKQVRVQPGGHKGVIGYKPFHLSTPQEREKPLRMEDLYIDIGAKDKEEALSLASPGDFAVFASPFYSLGKDHYKGKAIDDRFGCALLLELIRSEEDLDFDLHFAFTTREETGQDGAKVSANTIRPDIAIVLEATSAGDLPGIPMNKQVCALGKGPVISFMDKGTIYDKKLYDFATTLADQKNIPWQTKTAIAGANDAKIISGSHTGVRCLAISLPCRYIHSGSSVASQEDMENSFQLVKVLLQSPDLLMK